ncbi:MAG: hypothetical protein GX288_10270 [Clostridiales bacterium]|jgi:uncharacterized membrane protein HdeD (DUF308 family)|nr:hypothetical protein [Clostridiales bacterium]
MRLRKVGTLTLGAMLIVFGVLFLLHLFLENFSYDFIFKLWPIIFIFLGLEILYANFKLSDDANKIVYDKTAFVLLIILTFFAIGMAIAEVCIDYANMHMVKYIF